MLRASMTASESSTTDWIRWRTAAEFKRAKGMNGSGLSGDAAPLLQFSVALE